MRREIAEALVGSASTSSLDPSLFAPPLRVRATTGMKRALVELDRAMSAAQDACGRKIVVHGMAEQDPVAYAIGSDAYDQIEAIRRRISRAL